MHTDCYFRSMNPKEDHHAGGSWFIYAPKHCKQNQLLNPEHLLICYVNLQKDVDGILSDPLFDEGVRAQNILRGKKVETVSQALTISFLMIVMINIRYRTTSAGKGQATISHPCLHQSNIWIKFTTPSVWHLNEIVYNWTSCVSLWTTSKVIRGKLIVYPTSSNAYSATCINKVGHNAPAQWE